MTLFIFGVTVLIMVVVYLLFDVSGEKKVIEDIKRLKISVERHGNSISKGFSDFVTRNEFEKYNTEINKAENRRDDVSITLANIIDKLGTNSTEVSNLQEHQALLRKDLMELHEKISNKRPLIKMQGPIQVELFTPTKNLGRAGKKSVERASNSQPPPLAKTSVKSKKSQPLSKNI